ncbi:FAD-binding oxidoreductase [Pimelobacter simplex]|uniref:FAD-binding oxidoreductase n=1 Tax=Nocardioides simplex TaxID=2045 RepID=UPI00214FAE5B|nr:FAD-binding oxidoreductase [Pimelobacter simplex]UUW92527.1 FAD-binding oxidoreductase [Pimelobacter simplex]UUW96355.1 FAD-binding oxidoreductase [Pimelobacter simplex]
MSDLTVEEPRAALAPSLERATVDHEGEVIDVVELAPELKMTIIRLHMQAEFRPGQYAVLNLADGLRRCYSMAGLPGSDTVSFVTRRYPGGAGSQRLHSLTTGSRITLELPYGDMWLRPTSDPVVLIAGGTGISPVLSLANELAGTPEDRPVRAFYGAARPGDLVCSEELGALLEKLPDSALHLGAATADPQWAGAVGFVTDLLRDNLDLPWEVARYYLAGPPAMADAVLALLKARGVPNDRIHYDRFG